MAMQTQATHPLGIGVVGLGRQGYHIIERCRLREELVAVAACDLNVDRLQGLASLDCPGTIDLQQFLQNDQVELVVVTTPTAQRSETVVAALDANKNVIVQHPIAATLDEARRIVKLANEKQSLLSATSFHDFDDDFLAALYVVQSDQIGPLEAIHFSHWDSQIEEVGGSDNDALNIFGPPIFEQLLQLADRDICDVNAGLYKSTNGKVAGFRGTIEFPSDDLAANLVATIDVRTNSIAPVHTGWVLSGRDGGYSNFSQYTKTSAGEIYSARVASPSREQDQVLLVHCGRTHQHEANNQRLALQLVELMAEFV